MGLNPDTNRFEPLTEDLKAMEERVAQMEKDGYIDKLHSVLERQLLRPDGTPVPKHWSVFVVGEHVVIKNYTFKVAYIGESNILFEPVGPIVVVKEEK